MKKCFFVVAMLALAAPAFAYVNPSALAPTNDQTDPVTYEIAGRTRMMPTHAPPHQQVPPLQPDGEASPAVPEPGTMTLAAMGLTAAGAALRRRRQAKS